MSDKKKHNRPSNKGTNLLDSRENEQLFGMLGSDNYTLASGVAQLLLAQPPGSRQWNKFCTGVVCFVKDYGEKAYFIRVFDIHRRRQLWQQMLYEDFKINKPHRVLVTFEAEDCVAGLNFSDESEANCFKNAIDRRIQQALKTPSGKRQSSHMGDIPPLPPGGPPSAPPQMFNNFSSTTGVVAPYDSKPNNFLSSYNHSENNLTLSKGSKGGKNNKKKGAKTITKDDISLPTDFRHQVHVGWNPEKGFESTDVENSQDPSIKELLTAVGFNGLKKKEKKFVQKFITEHYGDIEKVQEALQQEKVAPPPPPPQRAPPVRQPTASVPVGPPPPPRDPPQTGRMISSATSRPLPSVPVPPPAPAALPPTTKSSRPPTQSPPVATVTTGIPPPPPPPPPPLGLSGPPPPPPPAPLAQPKGPPMPTASGDRSNLLDEIRRGVQLKQSDTISDQGGESETADTRDALLSQIKGGGVVLKKVEPNQQRAAASGGVPEQLGGIAGALARALQERRNQLVESDSDTDEESEDQTQGDKEWSD